MGLNLDLCHMIGAVEAVACPNCGKQTNTGFNDYDIECGNPNPKPGFWRLTGYCSTCERYYVVQFGLTPYKLEIKKDG